MIEPVMKNFLLPWLGALVKYQAGALALVGQQSVDQRRLENKGADFKDV